jgi:hypothetical protein
LTRPAICRILRLIRNRRRLSQPGTAAWPIWEDVTAMQVKLFIKDKSSFRSWRRHTQEFEDEINTWLAANPQIRVVDIKQSSNGGSFDTTKVVISIWYELNVEPDAPVDRAGVTTSQGVQSIQSPRHLS